MALQALAQGLSQANPGDLSLLQFQAQLYGQIGGAYSTNGQDEKAVEYDLASLKILEDLVKRSPPDPALRYQYAQSHAHIGGRGGEGACEHLRLAGTILKDLEREGNLAPLQKQSALLVYAMFEKRCK